MECYRVCVKIKGEMFLCVMFSKVKSIFLTLENDQDWLFKLFFADRKNIQLRKFLKISSVAPSFF